MNLKDLRKFCSLTQKEFASKLGVKQNTVCQYENKKRIPAPIVMLKMANVLNVSCEIILKCFICEN